MIFYPYSVGPEKRMQNRIRNKQWEFNEAGKMNFIDKRILSIRENGNISTVCHLLSSRFILAFVLWKISHILCTCKINQLLEPWMNGIISKLWLKATNGNWMKKKLFRSRLRNVIRHCLNVANWSSNIYLQISSDEIFDCTPHIICYDVCFSSCQAWISDLITFNLLGPMVESHFGYNVSKLILSQYYYWQSVKSTSSHFFFFFLISPNKSEPRSMVHEWWWVAKFQMNKCVNTVNENQC